MSMSWPTSGDRPRILRSAAAGPTAFWHWHCGRSFSPARSCCWIAPSGACDASTALQPGAPPGAPACRGSRPGPTRYSTPSTPTACAGSCRSAAGGSTAIRSSSWIPGSGSPSPSACFSADRPAVPRVPRGSRSGSLRPTPSPWRCRLSPRAGSRRRELVETDRRARAPADGLTAAGESLRAPSGSGSGRGVPKRELPVARRSAHGRGLGRGVSEG